MSNRPNRFAPHVQAIISALVPASSLFATVARCATIEVGPGKHYARPSQAIAAAAPGDTIEISPARYDGDVATIKTDGLTLRGAGKERVKIPAAGKSAGGKAI